MQRPDEYRSILCRLVDDREFQKLSVKARCVWFFLRVCPECGPIGLFRFYPALHAERLRMTASEFASVLRELQASRWVVVEDGFILIRNAMRFEPTFKPARDRKHLKALHAQLENLGHLSIARQLIESEGLEEPPEWSTKAQGRAIEGPAKAHRCTQPEPEPKTEPKTATENYICPETETAPVSGPPPEAALLTFRCDGQIPTWDLTPSYVAELGQAFPSLDILGECRKALAWIGADASRRKTARGMKRFLVGWLGRAQNNGNGRHGSPPAKTGKDLTDEQRANVNIVMERARRYQAGED